MNKGSFLQQRPVRWVAVFVAWTVVALFFASQSSLWDGYLFRQQITWQRALTTNLSFYYIWALITPFVVWLGKRFRLEQGKWTRSILVHFPTSILLAGLQLLIAESIWQYLREEPMKLYETFRQIEFSFAFNFHMNLLAYWAILGVSYFIENYRQFHDRELRASQLEAQLSKANLEALKMQLQPHFLFNTLNAISSLMHKDIRDADQVLARLGDLLRYSLETVGVQEVSLREELDFLRRYLEIERIRFGDRLRVRISADDGLLDARVPNLILQPLVENAIRYGVSPRRDGGKIEILARRQNGEITLVVRDDGPGLSGKGGTFSEGVGLQNTRSRLQQLYGDHHEFRLLNGTNSGLEVQITIPYHDTESVEQ